MIKILLLITMLIFCSFGGQNIETKVKDSLSIQPILNTIKKDMNASRSKNPKLNLEIVPIGVIPTDLFIAWKLPSITEKDSRIISIVGYGGIIWLSGDSSYTVIKKDSLYTLEWWKIDKNGNWNISNKLTKKWKSYYKKTQK
jgi:hypothetical protein